MHRLGLYYPAHTVVYNLSLLDKIADELDHSNWETARREWFILKFIKTYRRLIAQPAPENCHKCGFQFVSRDTLRHTRTRWTESVGSLKRYDIRFTKAIMISIHRASTDYEVSP